MKKFKSITAVIFAFALMFVFTGCSATNKAQSAVENALTELQKGDFEKAGQYLYQSDAANLEVNEDNENSVEYIKAIFKTLSWEIISAEEDGDTVVVKANITAIDMKNAMQDYITQAFRYALTTAYLDPKPTEEEITAKMEEMFMDSIQSQSEKTVTSEVEIKVMQEDGKWKVVTDEAFENAVTGGLFDAYADLG